MLSPSYPSSPCARASGGRAWLLLLAIVVACGGAPKRTNPLEKPEVTVHHVTVRPTPGKALTIDKSELISGLGTERERKEGEGFERYVMSLDRQRLLAYYVSRGYFRAQIHPDAARTGNSVDVVFEIDEGKRSKLAGVEITGLPANDPRVSYEKIRALIPMANGAPFNYDVYDLAKPALKAALERAGYARVVVDTSVIADQVADEATIRIEYTPGSLCTFGAVTIKGVEGDLASATRARLSIHEGEHYSTLAIADSSVALYDMDRYANVRVEPDLKGTATVIPVTVTVTLSSEHSLKLGGGVAITTLQDDVHLRAIYAVSGWPTALTTTSIEIKPEYVRLIDNGTFEPRVDIVADINRLDLFRPRLIGQIEAAYEYRTVEAFTSYGPRVRLGMKTPLYKRYLQYSMGWQLQELGFTEIDSSIGPALQHQIGIDGIEVVGSFEQHIIADLRDSPVEPRFGVYAEARVQEGGPFAGGTLQYTRIVGDLRTYFPLGPVVIATRGRIGAIYGDVPVTERFFGGGANSERGFPERQLSPFAIHTNSDGSTYDVVYGGAGQIDVSSEMRVPIAKVYSFAFGMVFFVDGGDVTERPQELNPSNLHWDVGSGLRFATPIGPVRIDVGYRLNRTETGEPDAGSHWAYAISIGEAY